MTQAFNLSQLANYLNSSGQVSAAGLQAGAGADFPSGTVVLFYQSAAPTGWTQVTSLNDYDLRLVSGAGGTTGGTTAYSTVFTNQTITISGNTGATTLAESQMPSHSHGYPLLGGDGPATGPVYTVSASVITNVSTYNTGGGGSHTHSMGGSGSVTLNVRYANVIICSKN